MDPLQRPTTPDQESGDSGMQSQSDFVTDPRSRSPIPFKPSSPQAPSHLSGRTAEPLRRAEPMSIAFDISSSSRAPRHKRRRSSTASLDDGPTEPAVAFEQEVYPKRRRLSIGVRASTPNLLSDLNHTDRLQEFEEGSSRARLHIGSYEEFDDAIDIDTLTETASPPPQSLRFTDASFLSQNSLAESDFHHATQTPQPDLALPIQPKVEPLSPYNCPICFSPPTYATLTPCGHVCCGDCLFAAVKTGIERAVYHGPAAQIAKCPVCRAPIPGWDGKGGGVIGLKPRVLSIVDDKRMLGP